VSFTISTAIRSRKFLKRGEIGRFEHGGMFAYITKEAYQESFSPEAGERLRVALERLAAQEPA
jgi:hypothetical protein